MSHLHNSRIIGQPSSQGWLRFRRFANPDVLDVGTSEYDVLVHLQTNEEVFFHIRTQLIQINTSSLGATGRSVGLASVPKDLTKKIMVLISYPIEIKSETSFDPDKL